MRGHYHNEQYVHCDARCDVRSLRSDIEIRCVPFRSESEARDAARRGTVFFLFSLQARVTQPQSLSLSLSLRVSAAPLGGTHSVMYFRLGLEREEDDDDVGEFIARYIYPHTHTPNRIEKMIKKKVMQFIL